MKRFWIHAVPLLLSACTVNTPVVDGPDASAAETLQTRCARLCTRYADCGLKDASDSCLGDCIDYFTETFVGRGDLCAKGGRRLLDCLDDAPCIELSDDQSCNIESEEDRCAFYNGEVICRSEFDYEGGSGSAPLDCNVGFGDCSDSIDYQLLCSPGDSPECQCIREGEITGRFVATSLICPTPMEAKQICGWPIQNARGEPPLPELVWCAPSASSSSGAPGFCSISFGTCSDGKNYAVNCDDSMGPLGCRCWVDDEIVSLPPSDEVCPFAQDDDGGVVALNYACGFHLALPGPP